MPFFPGILVVCLLKPLDVLRRPVQQDSSEYTSSQTIVHSLKENPATYTGLGDNKRNLHVVTLESPRMDFPVLIPDLNSL